jgi:hypothetical protein
MDSSAQAVVVAAAVGVGVAEEAESVVRICRWSGSAPRPEGSSRNRNMVTRWQGSKSTGKGCS